MTVSSTIRKAGPYTGTGAVSSYPFAFKVFQASDVLVVQTDNLGNNTTLALTTNYSVTLNADQNGNPGGTITLTAPLVLNYLLTISSQVPELQGTSITNNGGFYPKVIESALDYLTVLVQQVQTSLSNCLQLPISTVGVSTVLPNPAALNLIGWNANGTGLQNVSVASLAAQVAYGAANADVFTGNGVQTVFALSTNPGSQNNLKVSLGGVMQIPGSDFTWVSGTALTFAVAPPNGVKVLAQYDIGLPQGFGTATNTSFTQLGIGAVTRTSQQKLQESVSILDYGVASFTSMTTGVAAIQSFGGGTLRLPNGAQNTPVPGKYWNGTLQPGNFNGVVLEYDGPSVPVSMFLEQYGTSYLSQKVLRYENNTAHAGFGQSVLHIESTAYGTGNIGPTNADFAISINLQKLGAGVSARAGELDGMYIGVRNDGNNSDTTALLLDVGNYGAGFNAAFEANITYFYGGTVNLMMDVQCGVINSRTNNQYGLVLAAQTGVLGYGILMQSLPGANWFNFFVGAYNQKNVYQLKATGETYLGSTDGSHNVSFGIDPSTYAYYINVNSDALRVLSLDQSGNMSISGTLNVGGTTIIGGTAAKATAGGAALPANPAGFMTISRSGTTYKVPYYNN